MTPCTHPHLRNCHPAQYWFLNRGEADVGETPVLRPDSAECLPFSWWTADAKPCDTQP